MNTLIENTLIFLSHPFVICLFIVLIIYCIWYKKSGQQEHNRNIEYKTRKLELQKEREEIEMQKAELEHMKSSSIIYQTLNHKEKDSNTILLLLLVVSIAINLYLLTQLQEYNQLFGDLKEMSKLLKMFL